MKPLITFLAGVAVGAGVVAYAHSESFRSLKYKVRRALRKKGLIPPNDIDELVELISVQIAESNK